MRLWLRRPGWLCVLVPIVLWSSNAVLSKYLMTDGCGALEVLFYRSFGAVLFGLVFLGFRFRLSFRLLFSVPGLLMFGNIVCFNLAMRYVSGYLVMVLESTCFLFSFLYSRCRGDRLRVPWLSFVFMFLGFSVLLWRAVSGGGSQLWLGLFWGILTSVSFGLFNSTLLYGPSDVPRLYVLMLPSFLLSGLWTVPQWVAGGFPGLGSFCLLVSVLGFAFTGISYSLWGYAASRYSGARLSQLFLLTLPGTFLVEQLFLGSPFSLEELLGSVLLIVSIFLHASDDKC